MRNRWLVRKVFLSILSLGALEVSAQEEPRINVAFTNLMASQFNVGYEGVNKYTVPQFEKLYLTGWFNGDTSTTNNWYGPGPEGLQNYQIKKPAPVIAGPFSSGLDPIYHLLDNHHRTTAFYRLSTMYTNTQTVTVTNPSGQVTTTNIGPAPSSVYVKTVLDWSTTPTNQFWANMLKGNTGGITNFASVSTGTNGFAASTNQPTYVWNFNLGVTVTNLDLTPPPFIPGLTDDTLRGIGGELAKMKPPGYEERDGALYYEMGPGGEMVEKEGDVLYYQEFYWGNYLRDKVYWTDAPANTGQDEDAPWRYSDYNELLLKAKELVQAPEAASLPGYIPEPSSAALLVIGAGTLLALKRRRRAVQAGGRGRR